MPAWSVALLGFVALALLAYARVSRGWFLSDDIMIASVIPDGKHVDWKHVLAVFHGDWGRRGPETPIRYYRPLVILTQAVDAFFWGVNPLGFHLTNAVLHGVNGFLLSRVAMALGATVGASVLAGIAFVLFPWHTETVAWISGRTDLLSGIFMFASVLAYVKRRTADDTRRRRLLAIALGSYALALLCKEPAITVAPLVVALDLATDFDFRAPLPSLRRLVPMWAAYGAVALGYIGLRASILGNVWGGQASMFYGSPQRTFADIREDWSKNLTFLLTPFNRSALEGDEDLYAKLFALVGAMVLVGAVLAKRGRRSNPRLALASFLGFCAVLAPFASALHIPPTLENTRYWYMATAWYCLLLGVLASPLLAEWPSLLPSAVVVAVLGSVLQVNLTPWVDAGDIMQRVTHTYARAFGVRSGEPIEALPLRLHGAYMALYNADAFASVFTPGFPPRPDTVVRSRARYSGLERDIRVVPDPVFGAADRLAADRTAAEWLFPIDGSALDEASLEGMTRLQATPGAHAFQATSKAAWFVISGRGGHELAHDGSAEEFAYLLVRPPPREPPLLFWTTASGQFFGDPRFTAMRPELEVKDGQVAARIVDGYMLYVFPLHEHRHWPGIERIDMLRLDPQFVSERFEIGLFGVARRKTRE